MVLVIATSLLIGSATKDTQFPREVVRLLLLETQPTIQAMSAHSEPFLRQAMKQNSCRGDGHTVEVLGVNGYTG